MTSDWMFESFEGMSYRSKLPHLGVNDSEMWLPHDVHGYIYGDL